MGLLVYKNLKQFAIAVIILCIPGMILLQQGHEPDYISCEAEAGIVLQAAQCETLTGKNSSRMQFHDAGHLQCVVKRHRVRFKPHIRVITNSHSDCTVFPRWSRATST
ncbi:MAG: hypothetical protein ACOCWZ_05120 [Spirochaetota bacterium]